MAEGPGEEEQWTYLQLTLVRHGETEENKDRVLQGQKDTALSDYGRQQARLVGRRLAATETISHIFTSDLVRATETKDLILSELADHIEVTMDTKLRERAFGSLEGQPVAVLVQAAERARVKVKEYTPAGGETLEAVNGRIREFLVEMFSSVSSRAVGRSRPAVPREGSLLACASSSLPSPHFHMLLVSHGGPLHCVCEQLREAHGCQLPHRSTATPNTALTSFLLALQGPHCHSAHTITAHDTRHFSHPHR